MSKIMQQGEYITIDAPYKVASGDGIQIGATLFGIAASDAENGAIVTMITEGVHPLPIVNGVTIAAGDTVYFVLASKKITNVKAVSTIVIGAALRGGTGDTDGTASADVLLNKACVVGTGA